MYSILGIYTIVIADLVNKPNILFILADDVGWGNVGWHNSVGEVMTPNLDKLVHEEGLELNRYYVHYQCGPTRSSFQSGRLPVYLAEKGVPPWGGIPKHMTTIASKFKQAHYSTHYIGKWHCGSITPKHTPKARAYDTSLIYFNGANDYWKHTSMCCNNNNNNAIDLWQHDNFNNIPEGPAYNLAGTKYIDFLFVDKVLELIGNFTKKKNEPWFMVWSPHIAHDPMQIPKEHLFTYENDLDLCSQHTQYIYPNSQQSFHCRSIHLSMITLLDTLIASVINKLKETNLWQNTLLIFSSDNGGSYSLGAAAGNNYPLRGAKHTPFEGGIRVAAFVSGGYLPLNRRGLKINAMIHISDWYMTFCQMVLYDIDCFDHIAHKYNLPPINSHNIWPLIIGTNNTSPRTQFPIDFTSLMEGNYKLIITDSHSVKNKYIIHSEWPGPIFPNSSSVNNWWKPYPSINCFNGCLFDVVNDMTEHKNLIHEMPQIVKKMNNTLKQLEKEFYKNNIAMKQKIHCKQHACQNKTNVTNLSQCRMWMIKNQYNGFHGPWCDIDIIDSQIALTSNKNKFKKANQVIITPSLVVITDNLVVEQLIMLFISFVSIIFLFRMGKKIKKLTFKFK